jgi:xylose isomerase
MPLVDLRSQATRRTPDQILAQLQNFELDLKFSAGIWYFSPAASRFHDKYGPDLTIEQRLSIAATLAGDGLAALEAHYPNEINEQNVGTWQTFCQQTGIRVLSVIPQLFWDAAFEFGSLSNPDDTVRDMAIARTIAALNLNKLLNTDFAVVWPGIDGFELGFGLDFAGARARFASGLAAAMDAVPGVRIAFEPKPYEPRGHILYGTTPEGVLLGRDVEALLTNPVNLALLNGTGVVATAGSATSNAAVSGSGVGAMSAQPFSANVLTGGHKLCCLNPEVGHMLMAHEDAPYAFSWPLSEARLAHTHWNSQPLGNYDQDLGVSTISPEIVEAILYTLKMYGYQGYFGIDINPERVPVDVAIRNSMQALRYANDRVNSLNHALVQSAHASPTTTRGRLDAYLNDVRGVRGGA